MICCGVPLKEQPKEEKRLRLKVMWNQGHSGCYLILLSFLIESKCSLLPQCAFGFKSVGHKSNIAPFQNHLHFGYTLLIKLATQQ